MRIIIFLICALAVCISLFLELSYLVDQDAAYNRGYMDKQ